MTDNNRRLSFDSDGNENVEDTYEIQGVVSSDQVPNWARRPLKWAKLIAAVEKVAPGNSLTVEFPSRSVANRARNTVRDNINLDAGQAIIRTRVVNSGDGTTTVYFTRLHPSQVVEEKREDPE